MLRSYGPSLLEYLCFPSQGVELFIILSLKDCGTSALLWSMPGGETFLASIDQ